MIDSRTWWAEYAWVLPAAYAAVVTVVATWCYLMKLRELRRARRPAPSMSRTPAPALASSNEPASAAPGEASPDEASSDEAPPDGPRWVVQVDGDWLAVIDELAAALTPPDGPPPSRAVAVARAVGLAWWVARQQARGGVVVVQHRNTGERTELVRW